MPRPYSDDLRMRGEESAGGAPGLDTGADQCLSGGHPVGAAGFA